MHFLPIIEKWRSSLFETLSALGKLLESDGLLSAYELHSSGLVPAFQNILYPQSQGNDLFFVIFI